MSRRWHTPEEPAAVPDVTQAVQWFQVLDAAGRVAGGTAHDFNNYLTAIRGYLTFLLEDLPTGDPRRADVEAVHEVTERAAELTARLLDMGRHPVVQPGTVIDLDAAIAGMRPALETELGDGIDVILEPAAEAVTVGLSVDQLAHVLRRLAANARTAMPDGGSFAVRTAVSQDGVAATGGGAAFVELSVEDSGNGIAPAILPRVFEPFFSTKSGKVAGLGLTAVYRVVHEAGGAISITSQAGGGTTVVLRLPTGSTPPAGP